MLIVEDKIIFAENHLQINSEGVMKIEIICTGDEVLTGKIINTNFAYLSQKLEEFGWSVQWGVTVGDDRSDLLQAFQTAGQRADVVIVNGGLGPTVDDLSQEVAAQAAGVGLALHEEWLSRMEEFFARRGRRMPPNNRKQAMLPEGAEIIDNPIGTACGFEMDIGTARFYFTPGVPRELQRMLEDEILPRLVARSGSRAVIHLKRFHSFGLGESHVDQLLGGVEAFVPDGSLKLGFRAHYPQLEIKLTIHGSDLSDILAKLAPVEIEVRNRIGNFIVAEDDETLEGVVLAGLLERKSSLAVVETLTGGRISGRLAPLPGAEAVFRRGTISRHLPEMYASLGIVGAPPVGTLTPEVAETVAEAARQQAGATHALAVLVEMEEGASRSDLSGAVYLAVATEQEVVSRQSRLTGGRDWVCLGAVEMGLDSLRRHLQGLPLRERSDFEKTDRP